MKKIIDYHSEQHNILSLLPYSENAQLINKHQKLMDLYFLKSIVDFSVDALELFIKGNLVSFDAQVGENLCQIRAYKILTLAKKWLHSNTLRNKFTQEIKLLQNYKTQLESIIFDWENDIKHSKAYDKNLDGKENIHDFFVRHQLLIPLSDDFIFIIVCYFLTHFNIRDKKIPVAINLNYISRELHISKYRSKRLTHKYQQLICTLGCDFIIKIAQDLQEKHSFMSILPDLYQISDEDRAVLPCYTVSEIIFYHSIKERLPILFIAHQLTDSGVQQNHRNVIYFLLMSKKDESELSLIPCKESSSQHCMVVSGEVHYKQEAANESPKEYVTRTLGENLLKLILANTASHPQYSGKRLEDLKENPFKLILSEYNSEEKKRHENNLIAMQHFALNSGCSRVNPSLFFLRHIYASTVSDEIKQLENNYTGTIFEAYKVINS